MAKKILHTWRYEQSWLHQEHAPKSTPEETAQREAEIAEIIRQHNEESEFIPIPERLEKVDDLILLASAISHEYEMDMDIEQSVDGIDFSIYDFGGPLCGEAKNFIGRMFLMCNHVTIYKPKGRTNIPEDCLNVIRFSYQTHRHFVAGREILL